MNTTLQPYVLFGSTKPWLPPPWTTTDDRVRGGASQSYLSALPDNCANFHGHLDTSTLGGAGFASQFSPPEAAGTDKDGGDEERSWDLSAYDGIEVEVVGGKGDGKIYTLILKDEEAAGKRGDGREKAGINWEVDFKVGGEEGEGGGDVTRFFAPWKGFKATFRGKEKEDAGELKKGQVRRIGLMMRSYFGKQEGDFGVVLRAICARKTNAGEEGGAEERNAMDAVGRSQGSGPENTDTADHRPGKERGIGWIDWFSGLCTFRG
ncbi:hypothetical protein HO133_002777 [Letharia lupina]|uniref:NADH:ubiquinone oxidoreductase intermediate-associated protein 30 domain-containing protein n=1 Tax=Letharia lupina TaxID=560253 RepID=A0A8H6CDC2_9LECA|nr:uncharacterized protein HO133_002777 [Letharia lupina]KAF6221096.1 hypothetical protein HO133_002777 [Letharia lupina]